ncbi:MAG: NAD(P)-dependent oxidoreductase [Cyclobacteriaceae bacterium]|mgnify:CR=1 FL=1|nr:NAD(P)-dependent oxidoreductase [Cyclobacteriaceae bacterium]MDX5465404.1 NAD(P)-dependent oxidoreductase [Cyclobacteriaceae bacterium]
MSNISSALVTGANGLLGRQLAKHLSDYGIQVYGLVHQEPEEKIEGVEYLVVDLDSNWSTDSLPIKVDTIVHLAQSAHFREFPEKAMSVFQVNISSTARLLDYGRKVGIKSFVFASSGGVYGFGNQAFHENSALTSPGQLGYYLGSKLAGEVLVQSYAGVFVVNVLRFFFIYGPHQKKGMLMPRLMDSILHHRPISLQGQEGIRINPIHVEDASLATYAAILRTDSAVYNISGPEILSLKTVAHQMGDYLGIEPEFTFVDGEAKDLIGDNSAMKSYLHIPTRKLNDHLEEVKKIVTT